MLLQLLLMIGETMGKYSRYTCGSYIIFLMFNSFSLDGPITIDAGNPVQLLQRYLTRS